MLLEWIASPLNLLPKDPNSSVFQDFPLGTRLIVAEQVCASLLQGSGRVQASSLSSLQHVKVILECTGQAFDLPLYPSTLLTSSGRLGIGLGSFSILSNPPTPFVASSTTPNNNAILKGIAHQLSEGASGAIGLATEVYKMWLFDESQRPPCFSSNEQFLICSMMGHLSQIFNPRLLDSEGDSLDFSIDENALNVHIKLCDSILEIFANIGRQLKLTKESWEYMLKTILGIADSLLGRTYGDKGSGERAGKFAKQLSMHLLSVVFELWLRSKTLSNEMFDLFKARISSSQGGWLNYTNTICIWRTVCSALTSRVLSTLYLSSNHFTDTQPNSNTTVVVINYVTDFANSQIELEKQQLLFLWYKILHLIDNFELIPQSNIHLEAMRGLGLQVNEFMNTIDHVNQTSPDSTRCPDGNVIMKFFGRWLFEGANSKRTGFEVGKAEAIQLLFSIICYQPKFVRLNPEYLSPIYRAIQQALESREGLLWSVVLRSSSGCFFPCELKGSHVLLPQFVAAIQTVLSASKNKRSTIPSGPQIRKASLKLIGTILPLANHYGDLSFKSNSETISPFKDLNKILSEILLEGLSAEEDDDENKEMILWSCLYHIAQIFDPVSSSPTVDFAISFVSHLLSRIQGWSGRVISCGLRVLSNLSYFASFILKSNQDVAIDIITNTCKVINDVTSRTPLKASHPLNVGDYTESVILEAFSCLSCWISSSAGRMIVPPKAAGKDSTTSPFISLLRTIEVCSQPKKGGGSPLTTKAKPNKEVTKDSFQPTDKIREAAQTLFFNLLNNFENYPPKGGDMSCPWSLESESELISKIHLPGKSHPDYTLLSFYNHDKTMFSIVRHPRTNDPNTGISVSTITRDLSGRFVWESRIKYFPQPTNTPDSSYPVDSCLVRHAIPRTESSKELLNELERVLDDSNKKLYKQTLEQVLKCVKEESESYSRCDWPIEKPAAQPVYDDKNDLTATRLFLHHFGFASIQNKTNFSNMLQSFDGKNTSTIESLLSTMKQLDDISSRQCYKVSVLYLKSSPTTEKEVLECREMSQDFEDFISKIGWLVDLKTHKGYSGGLTEKDAEVISYYADFSLEIAYQINTLIHNTSAKKSLLSQSTVSISWFDDWSKKNHSKVGAIAELTTMASLNIAIYPLPSGLYHIKSFQKNPGYLIGPLLNEMVACKSTLATLIRLTVMNGLKQHDEMSSKTPKPLPITSRYRALETVSEKLSSKVPLNSYLSSLFTPNA
eukprot:TRINITY_DN9583_c0_g1_i1.p1 TRINITY_DN9583_c0_g1~~TRINITY_DN9583_c0_g1_i1.p1  ORF type:complete len:1236 (+),score=308.21 TRINITY_DN9583_c0_g1_i1:62-3769(+)